MNYLVKLVLTLLAFGLPITAQAACNVYPNISNGVSFSSPISVPSTLPVGGLIASQSFNGPFPRVDMNCSSPTTKVLTGAFTTIAPLPGVLGVFHTNVPGVGMRVMTYINGVPPYPAPLKSLTYTQPAGANYYAVTGLRAEFYKTGPITTGTVPSMSLYDERWDGNRGRVQMLLNTSIRFVNPTATCDLAAGDVNRTITLPAIKVSQLTGEVGVHTFRLTALCESNVRTVSFLFTGSASSGNGALFANTGTATGVGLSLSHQNVAYIPANGTAAQRTRQVATSGGRAELPMNAAYAKTGAAVRAGTLVSTVTVNITYN